jgi:hypothetical protein
VGSTAQSYLLDDDVRFVEGLVWQDKAVCLPAAFAVRLHGTKWSVPETYTESTIVIVASNGRAREERTL